MTTEKRIPEVPDCNDLLARIEAADPDHVKIARDVLRECQDTRRSFLTALGTLQERIPNPGRDPRHPNVVFVPAIAAAILSELPDFTLITGLGLAWDQMVRNQDRGRC